MGRRRQSLLGIHSSVRNFVVFSSFHYCGYFYFLLLDTNKMSLLYRLFVCLLWRTGRRLYFLVTRSVAAGFG